MILAVNVDRHDVRVSCSPHVYAAPAALGLLSGLLGNVPGGILPDNHGPEARFVLDGLAKVPISDNQDPA